MNGEFRFFVDMDGVLAKFDNTIPSLDVLYEKGYFRNLLPHAKVLHAINELISKYPEQVFIASAVIDSPFAKQEKLEWLHEYLPTLQDSNIIFTEYGQNKANSIPGGILSNDYLLDDYTSNLIQWENMHGTGIKLINNINNSNKSWLGHSIRFDQDAEIIENDIEDFLSKKSMLVYHGSPSLFHQFDYNHIGNNATSQGYGFYFTNNKEYALRYSQKNGYLYKSTIPIKKELLYDSLSFSHNDLSNLIDSFTDIEKEEFLYDYGDLGSDGIKAIKEVAINSLLTYSNNDVDLVGTIINSGFEVSSLHNHLYEELGYDHIFEKNENIFVSLCSNNINIEQIYHVSGMKLIPVKNPGDTIVNIDINYVDYDITSIQTQMKVLNQLFKEALENPNHMPDIRINLQIDNQDILKNERITIDDVESHHNSIIKQRDSILIEMLKDKSLENISDPSLNNKVADLFNKIVIEEIQITSITHPLGAWL